MVYTILSYQYHKQRGIPINVKSVRIVFEKDYLLNFVKKMYEAYKHTGREQVAFVIACAMEPIIWGRLEPYKIATFSAYDWPFLEIPSNLFENVSATHIKLKNPDVFHFLNASLDKIMTPQDRPDAIGFFIHTHPLSTLSETDINTLIGNWEDRFSAIVDMSQKVDNWNYDALFKSEIFKIFFVDAKYHIHKLKGNESGDKAVFKIP